MAAFSDNAKLREVQQLAEGLNSKGLEDKRTALKRVIAQMTLGKDMSPLFQAVVRCLEYQQLDIKKLVYLYIIHYSRSRPDDAIMTINLLRKDANNKTNPVIRALAVRTMSSLRVPKLNQYLVEPLKAALNDPDPYVRKTAVLSVPKVYELSMTGSESVALVSLLKDIVMKESNAAVLANAIVSIEEISLLDGKQHIKVDWNFLTRLVVAINECMEWAQVFILDFLCKYEPKNTEEAEMIVDRVLPRLSHINPTVVFSSMKLIIRYLDFLTNQKLIENLIKKIAPSIVSLVSSTSPEIQYIVLRNVHYIIEKQPTILENEVKCFFCKFTDPYYVKNEKIEVLIRIINFKNYESILDELREYIEELDAEFVTKCIRALGKIAIRYEKSVDRCITILAKKIKQTRDVAEHAEVIVNELLITTQNLLRKYPTRYNANDMFQDLVSLFEHARQPEAKQAAVWIIGEYAEKIYKVAMDHFNKWISSITSEDRLVQLQILSSSVKVFIKYPEDFQNLITQLLTVATEKVSNPDVRDRAYIYWRMLSTDPAKTEKAIFGYRPSAKDSDKLVDGAFLNQMISWMGYTCSVYEKRPDELFQKSLAEQKGIKVEMDEDDNAPEMPSIKDIDQASQMKKTSSGNSGNVAPITTAPHPAPAKPAVVEFDLI